MDVRFAAKATYNRLGTACREGPMRLLIDLRVAVINDGIEVKRGLLAFHRPVTRGTIRT